jgi:chromosome segregation ATPase
MNGSPSLDPIKATVDAYQTVKSLLSTLKTLDQKLPQVIEALSLIAQLQQDITEVSARNSQLERDLIQAERRNFELTKQVQSEEAWRSELDKLEKCQTENGHWVWKEKGTTTPLYCPNCLNGRKKSFLQHRNYHNTNMKRHEMGDYCPVCETGF